VLPRVTSDVEVTVSVTSPRSNFGEIETRHWWNVAVEGNRLSISSGGHFYRPSTGGDTFTTMRWEAIPEEPAELNDYLESLSIVPDARSFPDGIVSIDLASGGYTVEVTDEDNPLLEEDEETDEENSDEETGVEQRDEADEESGEDDDARRIWSIVPIDAVEVQLASIVDPNEVDANEPAHAYNVQNCGVCDCVLNLRGLFVDGRLRGDLMWSNMCAACFASKGEGLGWGNGQLYARQPDGKWRMVAGWRSSDAGT
jgi:hypothetical protein